MCGEADNRAHIEERHVQHIHPQREEIAVMDVHVNLRGRGKGERGRGWERGGRGEREGGGRGWEGRESGGDGVL